MFWNNEDIFPAQYRESENEALQTDILRFMAIIGFCLMAVFALIQAIPVTNPQKNTVIEDLSHDAAFLEAELDQAREDLLRQRDEIEKRPAPEHKVAGKEKGLYVAFESDSVFLNLLGSGKISLFINVTGMKQGFQVVKKDDRIDFKTGGPGKGLDLWEVKEDMVPFEILEAFKAWTTLSSREKILIVGLTPAISRQIRGRKVSGGRFIIKEGGSVVYSPHGE